MEVRSGDGCAGFDGDSLSRHFCPGTLTGGRANYRTRFARHGFSCSFAVAMLLTPLLARFFIKKGLHSGTARRVRHSHSCKLPTIV
jgi:hypothetical protein